ncbi:MAG: hypothetical protein HY859_07740 [Caulobacterales bacterium]|nr:hypothetical protein [Caulobacterales bacterium]
MAAKPAEQTRARPGLLRYLGIGVATAELAFLVVWLGLILGLLDGFAPYLWSLSPILLDSLPALFTGMSAAAVLGAAAGLVAAAVHDLLRRSAAKRAKQQSR